MLPEEDMIILNNAVALLEEVVTNGESHPSTVEGWFLGEQDFIKRTIKDLNSLIESIKEWGHEETVIDYLENSAEKIVQSLTPREVSFLSLFKCNPHKDSVNLEEFDLSEEAKSIANLMKGKDNEF